jgi:hypothetical protein
MNQHRRLYPLEPSTPSLLRCEPLVDGAPAPARTMFVLGEKGGYAATPVATNRLVLGRNSYDVHITVGAGDWYVSREHATLYCGGNASGSTWRLRNDGRLPIRIPDTAELLHKQEIALPTGYTPLYIRGSRRHVVEILISSGGRREPTARPETGTRDMAWSLTGRERLVLVAVFQGYLLRADDAHPLSWRDAGQALNEVPGECGWTDRMAEHVVDGVRRRLAKAGVAGITADSAHPEAIKLNLLNVLLETATLVPPDLRLLATGVCGAEA